MGCEQLLSYAGETAYYEVEIVKMGTAPQFGFAAKDSLSPVNYESDDGVGDVEDSWAVDGDRKHKWNAGHSSWPGKWACGDVIGLAANTGNGKIAVSKNGVWNAPGWGVIFQSDMVKSGVFPCVTAREYTLRFALSESEFCYSPPMADVWAADAPPHDVEESSSDSEHDSEHDSEGSIDSNGNY